MNKTLRYILYAVIAVALIGAVITTGIFLMNSDKPQEEDDGDYFTTDAPLFSYGLLPVSDENRLWGYINKSGEYAIAPQYIKADAFDKNGLAVVRASDKKYGVLLPDGSYALNPVYDGVITDVCADGDIIYFQLNDKYGLADINGNIIKDAVFDNWSYFTEYGYAILAVDDKFGIVDKTGEFTAEPLYDNLHFTDDERFAYYAISNYNETLSEYSWDNGTIDMTGKACETQDKLVYKEYEGNGFDIVSDVSANGYATCTYIADKDGNALIEPIEDGDIYYDEKNNCFVITDYGDESNFAIGNTYLLDLQYKRMSDNYTTIEEINKSPYFAFYDGNSSLYGYGKKYGGTVMDAVYEIAMPFDDEGRFAVISKKHEVLDTITDKIVSNGYEIIDNQGNVLQSGYQWLEYLCGELFCYSDKYGFYGIMNVNGDKLTDGIYSSVRFDENSGLILCDSFDADIDVINADGEKVMTLSGQNSFYIDGRYAGEGLIETEDGKLYYADTSGNALTSAYDYIRKQFNGFYYFEDNGICGFVSSDGKVILSDALRDEYESRSYLGKTGDGYFIIRNESGLCLYDEKGKRVGNNSFSQIKRNTFEEGAAKSAGYIDDVHY